MTTQPNAIKNTDIMAIERAIQDLHGAGLVTTAYQLAEVSKEQVSDEYAADVLRRVGNMSNDYALFTYRERMNFKYVSSIVIPTLANGAIE